jgi:hypothetical protein
LFDSLTNVPLITDERPQRDNGIRPYDALGKPASGALSQLVSKLSILYVTETTFGCCCVILRQSSDVGPSAKQAVFMFEAT